MYRKLKMSLLLVGIAMAASLFVSCSKDDEQLGTENGIGPREETNRQARQNYPTSHSLTIINNSSYKYVLYLVGAQTNYEIYDHLSIYHKYSPAVIVDPGQNLIFYNYRIVSNSQYVIPEWNVLDHSIRNGELGLFDSVKLSQLYGILTQPNNPASEHYPVWKWIEGGVMNNNGSMFSALSGNFPGAELMSLGSAQQGFNSVVKYGTRVDASNGTPLVEARWTSNNSGVRTSGEVRVVIKNLSTR